MQDLVANIATDSNPWWESPQRRLAPLLPWRRALQPTLLAHITSEARRAALLLGPRQVGKTTMLLQCVDDLVREGWPPANITYFDFSDRRLVGRKISPDLVATHRPPGFDPERPHVLLLDEVAKAEAWPEWLKQVVDRRTHRVVATDSAAFALREAGRESGVGRWDSYHLEGLTYVEFLALQARENESRTATERRLPSAFERYLARGGFPEYAAVDSVRLVRDRIREDIGDKALGRDLLEARVDTERVGVLFQYVMEDSGREFDANKVARALSGSGTKADPRSIARWISVLESTMLVTRLDNVAGTAFSRLKSSAHPRLYASDHGLIGAFAVAPNPTTDPAIRGRVFEAVAFRHLRALRSSESIHIGFHRRTGKRNDEIDFLVMRDEGGPTAIEVTTAANPDRGKMRQLSERAKRIKAARQLFVYGGATSQKHGSLWMVPLRELALETADWVLA